MENRKQQNSHILNEEFYLNQEGLSQASPGNMIQEEVKINEEDLTTSNHNNGESVS